MQGMFSRTLFVTLADGSEVVVQFRTEPPDLDAFKGRWARLSPMPDFLRMKNWRTMVHWAYSFTRMRGKMWHHGIVSKGLKAVLQSLATSLSVASFRRDASPTTVKLL